MMTRTIIVVFLAALLAACQQSDRKGSLTDPRLFLDLTIQSDEGRDQVICRLLVRSGGPHGDPVFLQAPAQIELDGRALVADSNRFSGVYYERDTTISGFEGTHELVYTDAGKNRHRTTFIFTPFGLAEEIPALLDRQPFLIHLKGLPVRETPVRLVITDTSFETNWVNELAGVVKGEVEVTEGMLHRLKPGPLTIELYREEEKPLPGEGGIRGRISYLLALKRETALKP